MNAKETTTHICQALLEKKGKGLEVLHVEALTTIAEYFVICSATSTTQVKALAENVQWRLKTDYEVMPHHTEGYPGANWILLDYGSVLVHVFLPEAREFYKLENLWKDAETVPLAELGITEEE